MRLARSGVIFEKTLGMPQVLMLGVLLAAWPGVAAAGQQSVLRCYGVETEIGIVARRDYVDDRGFVVKEVLYRSGDRTGARTCAEDMLRVYSMSSAHVRAPLWPDRNTSFTTNPRSRSRGRRCD